MPSGIVICFNSVQFLKVRSLTASIAAGSSTVVSFVQPENAPAPMKLTLCGKDA